MSVSPQTTFIEILDVEFRKIHEGSCELAALIPDEKLYSKPTSGTYSCGEYLLRSAAAVEQTFGGITARLWDDPFEWTLPEELTTSRKILEYLKEVESTRNKGFNFLTSDADLSRQIPAPLEFTTIFELLLQTISRASHLQGRATAVFQTLSPAGLSDIRTY